MLCPSYDILAQSGSLYFSPSSGNKVVGQNFSIAVRMNTGGIAINAVEGTIVYDSAKIDVVSISKAGSVFTIWATEPAFSNAEGTIQFAGGIPNPGYSGSSGLVFTVTFKAKTATTVRGYTDIILVSGAILANDGEGTNILSSLGKATYYLGPSTTSEPPIEQTSGISQSAIPQVAITSSTHPDQTKWYDNNNSEFSWTLPEGIDNVSYLLNQKPNSNPGSIPDGFKNSIEFTDIDNGIWYFHAKFGKSGKWGPIAHYKIQIDTIPPPILEITRNIDQSDLANPQVVVVVFKSTDDSSGIDFYQMKIGKGDWVGIDKSLEGQPYKLPMAQIIGFNNIGIRATDLAGNSTITEFDVDLIEKILVKIPTKQNELLEISGKAKPNKKLIISVLIAEAAKQMLGAQISSLAEESGNYTKKIEETTDENGNWQVELSDLPPVKYILAISLQDYSIALSKTPVEITVSPSWLQEIFKKILRLFDYFVNGISRGALFIVFLATLAGLMIALIKLFESQAEKWLKLIGNWIILRRTQKKSNKQIEHIINDIEEEIKFLNSIGRRRRLGPEENYLKTKMAQYLKTLKDMRDLGDKS